MLHRSVARAFGLAAEKDGGVLVAAVGCGGPGEYVQAEGDAELVVEGLFEA